MDAFISICMIEHWSVIIKYYNGPYLMTLVPSISLVSDIFCWCIADAIFYKIDIKNFRNILNLQ